VHCVQEDVGLAVKALFNALSTPPTKIAILGPSMTSETAVVAAAAPHFNLVQVTIAVLIVDNEFK
jgi:hypothetical protein